ncbi:uncharacterized protein [Apostichopus japonicus]|uniref:uncharacterized protein n=1 Tax=Stichopus japonicus TaxID=307972 RepID=UPI003AB17784
MRYCAVINSRVGANDVTFAVQISYVKVKLVLFNIFILKVNPLKQRGINMGHLSFLLILAIVWCVDGAKTLPQKCIFDWKIDWNRPSTDSSPAVLSFETPGVLVSGDIDITFSELLEFTGLLWNARSPLEITGLICQNYGPYIYSMMPDENFKAECNQVVTALDKSTEIDISTDCITMFETFHIDSGISDLVNQYLGYSYYCQTPTDDSILDFSNEGFECGLQEIAIVKALDIIEVASRVAFDLLDWLGPSPFSADVYGLCSALRLLSNMQIDDILGEVKSIGNYVVAEALELFNTVDGCGSLIDEQTLQIIDQAIYPDLQEGICDFFAGNPSQEEYESKADDIIDSILSVLIDKEQCINIVKVLTENYPLDFEFFETLTGFDIFSNSEQERFCAKIKESFSRSSQYTPSQYVFPENIAIDYFQFTEPGELLPNFYFTNALDVIGAFLRSETVADGMGVLCTVFEPLLTDELRSDGVIQICKAFANGDNVATERLCREITLPLQSYYPTLASLRFPSDAYVIVPGVDAMRKLFQLEELSPQSVCRALDNFASSPNNLQSVFRHILDAYITELLPMASDICNDYKNVINFLTYGRHQDIAAEIADLISKYLGFTNRNDLCRMISDGIDGESGRAKDDSTSFFVDEALMVFTNKNRCTEIIDISKVFFRYRTNADADEFIKLVTGYETTETLCELVTSSFADECSVPTGRTATRIYSPFVMLVMLLASGVFRSL